MSTTTVRPVSTAPVTSSLGGRAAIAYGVLCMGIGAAQAVRSGDTSVQIATGMRWILVAFAISLLVIVPAQLGLARFAGSSLGARIASVGTPLLAFGAMSSAINGQDFSWFPIVAVVANLLWFVGTLTLSVSLWRAGRVPRWVALLLPVSMPATLVLSQLGSGLVVGAFWAAIGLLMTGGRLARR